MPYAITRRSDGLLIEWDQEGHRYLYPAFELRLACRCASCIEEMSGRPLLDPASIHPGITPLSVSLVGAYGIKVRWSDGHDTGIYGFTGLLADCGCDRCQAADRR